MSSTTQSLVTLSLEKCFPARTPRWLILQRGPSLGLASLTRPTEGTPVSVLDGKSLVSGRGVSPLFKSILDKHNTLSVRSFWHLTLLSGQFTKEG